MLYETLPDCSEMEEEDEGYCQHLVVDGFIVPTWSGSGAKYPKHPLRWTYYTNQDQITYDIARMSKIQIGDKTALEVCVAGANKIGKEFFRNQDHYNRRKICGTARKSALTKTSITKFTNFAINFCAGERRDDPPYGIDSASDRPRHDGSIVDLHVGGALRNVVKVLEEDFGKVPGHSTRIKDDSEFKRFAVRLQSQKLRDGDGTSTLAHRRDAFATTPLNDTTTSSRRVALQMRQRRRRASFCTGPRQILWLRLRI